MPFCKVIFGCLFYLRKKLTFVQFKSEWSISNKHGDKIKIFRNNLVNFVDKNTYFIKLFEDNKFPRSFHQSEGTLE